MLHFGVAREEYKKTDNIIYYDKHGTDTTSSGTADNTVNEIENGQQHL